MQQTRDETLKQQRIEALIEIACLRHGWSKRRLAEELNRDPRNLVPRGSNPKLDWFTGMARILDWRPGEVVDMVLDADDESAGTPSYQQYSMCYDEALRADVAGRHRDMIRLARLAREAADTADRRAACASLEREGWLRLGRLNRALDVTRRAMAMPGVSDWLQRNLHRNAAEILRMLGDLRIAQSMIRESIDWYRQNPPTLDDPIDDFKGLAFCLRVSGMIHLDLATETVPVNEERLQQAGDDLAESITMYDDLIAATAQPGLDAMNVANRAALLEVDVLKRPAEALSAVSRIIEEAMSCDAMTAKRRVGVAWTCVSGARIALRHLTGSRLQESVHVLVERGMEIAGPLELWSVQQHLYTLQYRTHQALASSTSLEIRLVLDPADRDRLLSLIERFPPFRPIGWKIIDSAHFTIRRGDT